MMLAGFLDVWPKCRPLFCCVSKRQQSVLRHRFPLVMWIAEGEPEPRYDLWLGVGDTPIQVNSGLFFLEHLEIEFKKAKALGASIVLAGIGAEREATKERTRFSKALSMVDLISTRDGETSQMLTSEFSVDPSRIMVGEDLAHIYLKRLATRTTEMDLRPLGVAVNYYAEGMSRRDSLAVLRWLKRQQSVPRTAAFLSNEGRMTLSMESRHYAELAWCTCLDKQSESVALITPNCWAPDLDSMVCHFSMMQTVLSSRFHCLLSAAWFGCKVYGLGRSSKVATLCKGIGINFTERRGVNAATLDNGFSAAGPVCPKLLDTKAEGGRAAVEQLLCRLPGFQSEPPVGVPAKPMGSQS